VNQLQLPLPTDFELITTEHLMMFMPRAKAIEESIKMVKRWNDKRVKLGLKVWV